MPALLVCTDAIAPPEFPAPIDSALWMRMSGDAPAVYNLLLISYNLLLISIVELRHHQQKRAQSFT